MLADGPPAGKYAGHGDPGASHGTMRARRVFYEGLAAMLGAGIPVRTALAQAASGARGSLGEAVRHLEREAGRGRPLADAMEERPGAFPRVHVELVRAAETSGSVDRTLRALAATEAAEERNIGRVAVRVAYPLFVVHFAAVPLNIAALVQGHFLRFLGGCVAFWIPIWVLAGGALLLFRRARTGGGAARFLLGIPVLGGILRDGAYVRWARVFAALEDAGVDAALCTERAAAAAGYAVLERDLAAPAAAIRRGVSRAEAFARAGLPSDLYQALAQGEVSGTIAEGLGRAAAAREEAASARSDAVMNLLPAAATILAGLVVAWVAISFFAKAYTVPR